MLRRCAKRVIRLLLWSLFFSFILTNSGWLSPEQGEKVRAYTRAVEFDYVSWTLNAILIKFEQVALGTRAYLPEEARHQVVSDYLRLVGEIQQDEYQLSLIYADPNVKDPQAASVELRQTLSSLYQRRRKLAPLAEAILQGQLNTITAALGLSFGGQALPPVLYHSTPLPLALIVSPRNVIRQDEDISLLPELTVDQQAALEGQVDRALDVSSLVVPVGGIGVYPTMVMQTTDLNWLVEAVAHEWVHNFLTTRPLGLNYYSSPELRTMNESTAAIAGVEIGRALIARFYPELLPPPPEPASEKAQAEPAPAPEPPAFDFRFEMYTTRVAVDQMLEEGKFEEAEEYMEARRQVFWNHGYLIRKINQAYFAFYGAYADQPGGAAGEDPVGAAVRALRAQSPSLAVFIKTIAWYSAYEQLQQAVQNPLD